MRILKAYADAAVLGQQGTGVLNSAPGRARVQKSKSGDCISISSEALNMQKQDGMGSISVMPQDATYDQRGQVLRQFDTLQGEMRALTSQFMSSAATQDMLGPMRQMQSQLTSLRAQV